MTSPAAFTATSAFRATGQGAGCPRAVVSRSQPYQALTDAYKASPGSASGSARSLPTEEHRSEQQHPSNAPRYILELEPAGGDRWAPVPPAVRLRRLLKAAARAYGLRVVQAVQTSAPDPRSNRRAPAIEPETHAAAGDLGAGAGEGSGAARRAAREAAG